MRMKRPVVLLSVIGFGFVLTMFSGLEPREEEPVVIEYEKAEPMLTLGEDFLPTTTEEIIQRREISDADYNLMVRVVMSETGGIYGEPMEGKVAVAVTILNRADMGYGSISQIVSDAYSTANNGSPDYSCYDAVELALTGQHEFPDNMIAFRTDHYHGFGYPYDKIGNHYFSCVDK